MQQLTVITAVGSDRPGVVHDLTRAVLECGGNIVESRMSALGSEFAMLLLVSGNWHTLARLEENEVKIDDKAVDTSIWEPKPRSIGLILVKIA